MFFLLNHNELFTSVINFCFINELYLHCKIISKNQMTISWLYGYQWDFHKKVTEQINSYLSKDGSLSHHQIWFSIGFHEAIMGLQDHFKDVTFNNILYWSFSHVLCDLQHTIQCRCNLLWSIVDDGFHIIIFSNTLWWLKREFVLERFIVKCQEEFTALSTI